MVVHVGKPLISGLNLIFMNGRSLASLVEIMFHIHTSQFMSSLNAGNVAFMKKKVKSKCVKVGVVNEHVAH